MGIYLNPGNENFKKMIAGDIYVDKTMMIEEINTFIDKGNSHVCVSRPRRFGKTMAGNMLSSYYSKGCDSRELFAPFKISKAESFEEKLNKYNVIKIDMNSEYQNTADKEQTLKRLTREIRREMIDSFTEVKYEDDDTLANCIQRTYAKTGETFILLIDEYDVLVREQVSQELFDEYISFLSGLFKSDTLRPAIELAYLTGILPVVRDKIQSKLNNFREYTILDAGRLAEFIGFTSEEVKELCEENGIDFAECRRWYDGYRQHGYEIYNPESVVRSIEARMFASYWGQTSTYEAISDRIQQNFEGTKDAVIRMLTGENIDVDPNEYLNTMTDFNSKEDVFTYLIHLGYLAYNREDGTCRIPNGEVRQEWFRAIKRVKDYEVTNRIIKDSKQLLEETLQGNEAAVAEALDRSHIHVSSNRSYNNEDALAGAIYLAYIYALNRYTVVKEMTAGKGFADVVFIPFIEGDPAIVVELKRNDNPDSAIRQIKEKKYPEALADYSGPVLLAGINYDEKTKEHSCVIEWMEA